MIQFIPLSVKYNRLIHFKKFHDYVNFFLLKHRTKSEGSNRIFAVSNASTGCLTRIFNMVDKKRHTLQIPGTPLEGYNECICTHQFLILRKHQLQPSIFRNFRVMSGTLVSLINEHARLLFFG